MSDDEWNALLALWHTPRHKKTCDSNKANREKVKFQQKTGSRCYPAHIFATREERNGEELTAVDLFKSTQTSKKNGLSLEAKDAIVEMERMMTEVVPEGEQRKSDVEIVAAVLKAKECPSSTFLQNVGLKSSSSTSKGNSSAVVAAHVRDLQDKLERSQMEVASLKKRSEDAEAAQVARDKEVELLRKKAEEHDARYAHLLALIGASSN